MSAYGTGNEAEIRLINGEQVQAKRESGIVLWYWTAKGESDRTLHGLKEKLNKKAGKRPWWAL